jgi:hypothetical protein
MRSCSEDVIENVAVLGAWVIKHERINLWRGNICWES